MARASDHGALELQEPAALVGTDEEKRAKFGEVYRQILGRIHMLVRLPLTTLDRPAGEQQVRAIGAGKP